MLAKFGLILMALSSTFAYAGQKGNGGGGWVCREKTGPKAGQIRWVKLVDLFEAESEFGLKISRTNDPYAQTVDSMRRRLFLADRDLYAELSEQFSTLNNLQHSLPQIQHTQDTLEVINDSLYRLKPNISSCKDGQLITSPSNGELMIPYEQIVNYKDDGTILVQAELFSQLPEYEKAALVFHEAVYAYLRLKNQDTNSIKARRLVGLIFSSLSEEQLRAEFANLGFFQTGTLGIKVVGNTARSLLEALIASDLVALPDTDKDIFKVKTAGFNCRYDNHAATSLRGNFSCERATNHVGLKEPAFLASAVEASIPDNILLDSGIESAASGKIVMTIKSIACTVNHLTNGVACLIR